MMIKQFVEILEKLPSRKLSTDLKVQLNADDNIVGVDTFPKNTAGHEVSEVDLDQDDFQFHGEQLTEARAAKLAEEHWSDD